MRICHALDEHPSELARNAGISYEDIVPLIKYKGPLSEDDAWWKIKDYVSAKTGMLMAIGVELNVALQKDRARRITNYERVKEQN
ncbi:hypothetical protein EKK58_09160 [Candidatus Dependentiae bacterium]|nr:MAG: hypothetical protein EKK58_09160 [Candidatus Dependentiae bacterium]